MYPTKEELIKEINNFEGKYLLRKYNIKRRLYESLKDNTVFFFREKQQLKFLGKRILYA